MRNTRVWSGGSVCHPNTRSIRGPTAAHLVDVFPIRGLGGPGRETAGRLESTGYLSDTALAVLLGNPGACGVFDDLVWNHAVLAVHRGCGFTGDAHEVKQGDRVEFHGTALIDHQKGEQE